MRNAQLFCVPRLAFVAFVAFVASASVAAPVLQPLANAAPSEERSCRYSLGKDGPEALRLHHATATVRIDGKTVSLSVRERRCMSHCVAPGRSGVRTFDLAGPGVSGTLVKAVACAKDAEDCGGLPSGEIALELTVAGSKVSSRLWGEYCDR